MVASHSRERRGGVSDVDDIIKKLNRFVVDTEKAVDETIRSIGVQVKNAAVKSIRDPSVGTVYLKGGKVRHISSKAGAAPNTDTGRLIGSIVMNHKKFSMVAHVGTSVMYGAILETIKNRPWLKPALDSKIGNYRKTLEKRIDKQIRAAGR